MNYQEELRRLWEASLENYRLIQSVKREVDSMSAIRHSESTESISETQLALAELGGLLTGEDVEFVEPEENGNGEEA